NRKFSNLLKLTLGHCSVKINIYTKIVVYEKVLFSGEVMVTTQQRRPFKWSCHYPAKESFALVLVAHSFSHFQEMKMMYKGASPSKAAKQQLMKKMLHLNLMKML
uniref:Uncharacterized protein n=1 Tax=Glossina palpalis gambiensis TaxID=67801 RepID=A0A1B0BGQ5_9MUSC